MSSSSRFRVCGNPKEPLRQVPDLWRRSAAPAPAGGDLFVSQHRLARRTPIDLRHLPVSQAPFVEAEEEPLVPAIILRVAGAQHPAPVVREAEAFAGSRELLDVSIGPLPGVYVVLNRGILGGQSQGVVAERVQDVVPTHPQVAGDGVSDREVADVPHVHVARRVREHFEDVTLWPPGKGRREPRVFLLPRSRPSLLNGGEVVPFHSLLAPPLSLLIYVVSAHSSRPLDPVTGCGVLWGPPSGRLIVYRAQTSSATVGIGAGSVSCCSFRMDRWLK
jgi:hypothetical protein